jgi:hypothetical protein
MFREFTPVLFFSLVPFFLLATFASCGVVGRGADSLFLDSELYHPMSWGRREKGMV